MSQNPYSILRSRLKFVQKHQMRDYQLKNRYRAIPGLTIVGNQLITHAKDDPWLDLHLELLKGPKILVGLGWLLPFFDFNGVHFIPLDNQQVDLPFINIPIV